MFRTIIATAAILTVTGSVALADGQASVDVPFGDLNLSRTQDARILADRLQIAAKEVCQKANGADIAAGRIGQQAMHECVKAAISIAMERVAINLEEKVRANLISGRLQVSH